MLTLRFSIARSFLPTSRQSDGRDNTEGGEGLERVRGVGGG